jgi:hypothetical protein
MKRILFFILTASILAQYAHGQLYIMGPGTSISDPKSLFANPSLISFQRSKLAIGVKGYHMGLLDESGIPLKQGYLAITSPFLFNNFLGGGIGIQYFDSHMYNRVLISGGVAARIFRFISVGAYLSALNISYDESKFDLVDQNDPVFNNRTGKTTINTTVGIYAQPLEFISFGLGIRNINEPNLSLIGSSMTEKREFFAGVTYIFGPFRSTIEFLNYDFGLDTRFYLETFSTTGNYFRAASTNGFSNIQLEGQLHITGPVSINYNYELPMSDLRGPSAGSHMVTVIFEFARTPRLPDAIIPPVFTLPFTRAEITSFIEPRIYLTSEVDYVKYYEKQLIRKIDPNVSEYTLASLSSYDIGVIDSSFTEISYPYRSEKIAPIPPEVRFNTTVAPAYTDAINRLSTRVGPIPIQPVTIVSDSLHLMKAFGLYNLLTQYGTEEQDYVQVGVPRFDSVQDSLRYISPLDPRRIAPYEDLVILEPNHIRIFLHPTFITGSIGNWRFIIENSRRSEVKRFSGIERLPEYLVWNLRDEAGDIIEPGIYNYYIVWEDRFGSMRETERHRLFVQKFLRRITVEITHDRERIPDRPDKINLIIKN